MVDLHLKTRPLLMLGLVAAGVLFVLRSLLVGSHTPFHYLFSEEKNEPCVWCLTSPEAALKYEVSGNPNPNPEHYKINAVGQYIPILGYTVISFEEANAGLDIKSFLGQKTILTQYISPLPEASYHVTILDIYNHYRKTKGNRTWVPDNVSLNIFIPVTDSILAMMTEGDEACRDLGQHFTVKFTRAKFAGRPGRALTIRADIQNDDWVAPLRKRLGQIFQHDDAGHVFHMTLGYVYRPFPEDKETRDKLMAEIHEVESFMSGRTMKFLPPEVHVFHDMTCFTPFRDFMHKCYRRDLWHW